MPGTGSRLPPASPGDVTELNPQLFAQNMRGPAKRVERDSHVPGIEKAVQLRTAGLQLGRHGALGLSLPQHLLFKLPRKHPLDGCAFNLAPKPITLFFEEVIETRSRM